MIMRKSRSTSRNRVSQFVNRVLRTEALEPRVLLAADTGSAWQNPLNSNDVDQNGVVTWQDALSVIRTINHEGPHQLSARAAGEPDSGTVPRLPDTNGDGFLTAADPLQVINSLNGEGEGELARYRLEVVDSNGDVASTVNLGDTLLLNVYVQDLRDASEVEGIFAGYLDIEFDSSKVLLPPDNAILYGDVFDNGQSGNADTPGLLDEAGAFVNTFGGFGGDERLLLSVAMLATDLGDVTFTGSPADDLPAHETLFFGTDDPIAPDDIDYGSATVTVVEPTTGSPDLIPFANNLRAAGVEFWSTRSFNRDAVAHRALFDDGADFLPIREALDGSGNLNSEAIAAGVTEVNTWIFPDGTQSSEMLTLEEISQRSGIPMTYSELPTLIVPSQVTLTNDSPIHIPLNGYDPEGGPITYEVITDGGPATATILQNNRSWRLDVDGYGPMVFEFFEQRAGRATDRFIELTEDGFYDGITFHRIIDDFVIQGGDPTGTGSGSSSLPDFDDQFHFDLQHNQTGVLSMAKAGDDTNNSQFFITEGPQLHLDFNHTVFGQLIEGEATREAISEAASGQVTIESASVFTDTENATLMLHVATADIGVVTVRATDSQGNTTTQEIQYVATIDSRNTHPFLSDIPDFTAAAGTNFEFQLESNDIEDNSVFYFVDRTSPGGVIANVSDTGLVTVEIPADAAGTEILVDVAVSESSSRFSSNRDEQRVRIAVDSNSVEADSFTVDEDSMDNVFDVLANDGLGSDAIITGILDDGLVGTVEISQDGKSILYSPEADFVGMDSFGYAVTSRGAAYVGTVNVTVDNVIDGPNANDDFFPGAFTNQSDRDLFVEDSSGVILAVLTNDRPDPDQEEIVLIVEVTQPAFGTVETNGFNITYTPSADFSGTDTFTYTIEGTTSKLTSTATVTLEVPELNDPPVAGDDAFTVTSGELRTFTLSEILDNDSAGPANESDQVLTITEVSYQGTGTVTLESDGSIRYTSADGFGGVETIEYTLVDNGADGGSAAPLSTTGTITVTVPAPSFARADDFDVDFASIDNLLDVLANDNGAGLEIISVTTPGNGSAVITDGGSSIEYTPNANFAGADTFSYTARNGQGDEGTATITVTVDSQAPTANDDQFTVTGDMTLDVLDNDQLGAGASSFRVDQVTQPANGMAIVLFGGTSIDFRPDAGFVGSDSFTYTIVDDAGKTSTATVSVTVEATPNNPPLAFNDDVELVRDGGAQLLGVLDNDTALPDTGEMLSVEAILTPPTNGTAEITAGGNDIRYTPNAGFEGADTLVYRVNDGNGGTATASVDITVEAMELTLIAVDDLFSVETFGRQFYSILSNDTGATRISSVETSGTSGQVTISEDGTQIVYTPDFGAFGEDTFTYSLEDADGVISEATVRVNVPDLLADSYFGGSIYTDLNGDGARQSSERGLGGVAVILEGTDSNGDDVRMQTKTGLHGGFRFERVAPGDYTVTQVQPDFIDNGQTMLGSTLVADDTLRFSVGESLISADANAFGEAGLTPRMSVFNALSSARGPGLFAVLENDQLSWVEPREGWGDIANLDLTVDDGDLVFRATDNSGLDLGARVSLADPGAVTILGTSGDHTFVRIAGASHEVMSEGAIDDVFGEPSAVNDFYTVDEDGTLQVDAAIGVLSNDSDPDGDALLASLVLEPSNGSLSLSDDGSFVYEPDPGFFGEDSFRYRANDGQSASNVAVVTVQVNEVVDVVNELFASVTTGSFEDPGLLGIRTDLVPGAPAITARHIDGDIDYTGYSNPPTYGDHHGFDPNDLDSNPGVTPRTTGVYTEEQPEEDLIHNLEHGHVWISYNPDLISGDDLEALEQFVRDGSPNANGGGVGVILTPRAANDAMIAVASWARLLELDSYDPETIRNFVNTNRGKAPEGFITP